MNCTRPVMVLAMALAAAPIAGQAAGDPVAGATKFATCKICHSVTAGAPRKIGPNLSRIVGKHAATSDAAFAYSPALKAAGLVWTEANLDKWLAGPSKLVPGNRMAFAGQSDPKVRANLIAYLKVAK